MSSAKLYGFIEKLNEVRCQVRCDDKGVLRSIYDKFTVDSGADHYAVRNNPHWDGNLHLFRGYDQTLYTGLIPELMEFLQEEYGDEVDFIYDPQLFFGHDYELSVQDVNKIIADLNIHSSGIAISARDHQLAAIYHCLRDTCRAVVVSPTGSGKSFIIYVILRFLQAMGLKVLLVVPNLSLIQQMFNDFKDYSSEEKDWQVQKEISVLTGANKTPKTNITLANWQAIYKLGKKFFGQYGAVIVDEVHLAAADSLKGIMEQCSNAHYRYGFTGTLQETKTHLSVIEGLFGPSMQFTTSRELQDKGVLSNLEIKMILLQYSEKSRKLARNMEYHEEVDFTATSKAKERFIVALANKLEENVLILVNLVEKQLKPLYNALQKTTKKKIFVISGATPSEERERIRTEMENGKGCVLLATYGTCSTGINIKNIHHIIFGAAFKSKIRVLQSIGRELRVMQGKNEAVLWDLVDDLTHVQKFKNGGKKIKMNHLMRHAQKRMQTYRDEEFPYEIMRKRIEKEDE